MYTSKTLHNLPHHIITDGQHHLESIDGPTRYNLYMSINLPPVEPFSQSSTTNKLSFHKFIPQYVSTSSTTPYSDCSQDGRIKLGQRPMQTDGHL